MKTKNMDIKYHSTVIMTNDFDKMKAFYQEILQQEVAIDFGNCIGFKNGISLWKLSEDYPIAKQLGKTYDQSGNKNLEICFETDDYEKVIAELKKHDLRYLHETIEERWGQKTVRFYDPENNLVEIGETIPCFVKRFYKQGMTVEKVSERTSVPIEMVREICTHQVNGYKTLKYNGFIPPCGIFCGGCPVFKRDKNRCEGAAKGCNTRKCKGIYICCIEKKGLDFCHECKSYPCSRYQKFADRWKKYGQDLLENQDFIREHGKEKFIEMMNNNAR